MEELEVAMSSIDEVLKSARSAEAEKNWHAAAEFYKQLSVAEPEHANWHYRQGLSLERARQFDRAIDAYQIAVKLEPRWDWWHRLGTSAEGAGKLNLSKEALLTSISLKPNPALIERQLVQNSPKAFSARLKTLAWLQEKLPLIRQRVNAHTFRPHSGPARVFTYWDSGVDRAPAIVKTCHREMQRFHSQAELHVLNSDTWRFYVELPSHVVAKLPANRAHFSDVLRVALLSRYGGMWADMTCLCTQNLPKKFDELTTSGFFAFQVNGPRISNWFLCSSGDNYIPRIMFETLSAYWAEHDDVTHYFMFHHMFEILYYLDDRVREIWDGIQNKVNSTEPHLIQHALFSKFDAESFQKDYQGAVIHKLTHKLKDQVPTPDLVISHIMRGDFYG